MKAEIHPSYTDLNVVCGCGNKFTTQSTMRQDLLKVDVCDKCHPFYTGKHKILDTEGRVDQFMRRYGAGAPAKPKADEAASSDTSEA